jgi:hypothetical protein
VKNGAAHHDVGKVIGKIHLLDRANAKVRCRQVWGKLRSQGSHVLNTLRICIDCEDLASFAEEMHKVSSVPATSVEDTHPGCDISSQDLIEDVDINLSKLLLHVHCDLSNFHLSTPTFSPTLPFLSRHALVTCGTPYSVQMALGGRGRCDYLKEMAFDYAFCCGNWEYLGLPAQFEHKTLWPIPVRIGITIGAIQVYSHAVEPIP